MKRLLAVSGLLLSMFVFASAQKTVATNFAGTWEADMTKTKLSEGGRGPKVLGQTLTVTQDAKTITVAADTKTDGMAIPASNRTYNLDGTESTGEVRMMQNSAPAKLKATVMEGGKLELDLTANLDTPMGAMTLTQNDTWELMDGGKTLRVHRNRTSPRGSEETDWFYNKK